jgi:hypothetical protein
MWKSGHSEWHRLVRAAWLLTRMVPEHLEYATLDEAQQDMRTARALQ